LSSLVKTLDSYEQPLEQRGPTTFDLWAILHRRDNTRATSNEM